jgi:hypothetical protein
LGATINPRYGGIRGGSDGDQTYKGGYAGGSQFVLDDSLKRLK